LTALQSFLSFDLGQFVVRAPVQRLPASGCPASRFEKFGPAQRDEQDLLDHTNLPSGTARLASVIQFAPYLRQIPKRSEKRDVRFWVPI
jgi:hypothetical protein